MSADIKWNGTESAPNCHVKELGRGPTFFLSQLFLLSKAYLWPKQIKTLRPPHIRLPDGNKLSAAMRSSIMSGWNWNWSNKTLMKQWWLRFSAHSGYHYAIELWVVKSIEWGLWGFSVWPDSGGLAGALVGWRPTRSGPRGPTRCCWRRRHRSASRCASTCSW